MLRFGDAVAHAEVLADFTFAVVDQTVATLARLELLDENCAKLGIHLGFNTNAAEHRDDTGLGRLLLGLVRRDKLFVLDRGACEWVVGLCLCRQLGHCFRGLDTWNLVDKEAPHGLEADAEAGHMRAVVRLIEGEWVVCFCGLVRLIEGEWVVCFCGLKGFNHLLYLLSSFI